MRCDSSAGASGHLDTYSPISVEHRPIAVTLVLASWCADCFHMAPCLHVTGSNWACVCLLRALSLVCRCSLLVGHASLSSVTALPRDFTPTLLFAQNDISSRVMDTLVASNDRAMVVTSGRNPLHLYGAKVFTCEEFPTHSFAMPVCVGPFESLCSNCQTDQQIFSRMVSRAGCSVTASQITLVCGI